MDVGKQLGVDTAVVRFWGVDEWWDYDTLLRTTNRFEDYGFSLDVVEDRPPMEKTVLGKPGRDEEIATVKQLIRNMGEIGIDVYCWVWTENPVGVVRTSDSVPRRGNSRTTAYDHEQSEGAGPHPAAADVTDADLWENLQYFLDEVVPVARTLASHSPSTPTTRLSRRSAASRVSSLRSRTTSASWTCIPDHGVTFCQGNFAAMGGGVTEAIRRLGDDIHFVHFRDVDGPTQHFVETWQDEGPTDMRAAIIAYREVGFEGPIRPDHVPKMAGETHREEAMAGYTDMGRLFAVGYIEGLLETTEQSVPLRPGELAIGLFTRRQTRRA